VRTRRVTAPARCGNAAGSCQLTVCDGGGQGTVGAGAAATATLQQYPHIISNLSFITALLTDRSSVL
jgi:hypothetical protein